MVFTLLLVVTAVASTNLTNIYGRDGESKIDSKDYITNKI